MIIEREILKSFEKWKNETNRRPLIVQGARQIGKSWAVENFGRKYFKHTAIFNFDKDKELKEVFAQTKDIQRLIFFDEVQNCKGALNSLKYFNEDAPEFMSWQLVLCLESPPGRKQTVQ